MRNSGVVLVVLGCFSLLPLSGCFDQEEPTCEYWVPKLTTATRGEKALDQVQELKCAQALPILEKMFEDGQFRDEIVRATKEIDDRNGGARILKKAILTRDVGKLALSIVSDWRLAAARSELLEILTGPGLPKSRLDALKALLTFAEPGGLEDVLIGLAEEDPDIQGIEVNNLAVEKLGEIASVKAVPTIIKNAFRKSSQGGSIYLTARVALSSVGKPAIDALLKVVAGEDAAMNEYAKTYCLEMYKLSLGEACSLDFNLAAGSASGKQPGKDCPQANAGSLAHCSDGIRLGDGAGEEAPRGGAGPEQPATARSDGSGRAAAQAGPVA